MQRKVVPESFKDEEKLWLNDLMDETLGQIILLDSDPTTVGGEIEVNQIGFNQTTSKLFININGTTFSLSLTAV